MKIAVFADSHRTMGKMLGAVASENPDAVFHLGDLQPDADKIRRMFPEIPVYSVYGNCDTVHDSTRDIITEIGGMRIFATHGHAYNVKYELDTIIKAARDAGADILMFGHTHRALEERRDGLLIINPGSVGYNREYGILTISDGKASYEKKTAL